MSLFRPRIDAPLFVRAARRPALWAMRWLAHLVVRRHRPLVVGVTGSVGKTTTKDLIAELLRRGHRVGVTPGSAGNELGAALTVLGVRLERRWPSGIRLRDWLAGYARGVALLALRGDYPEVLVLEMASGRPGELRRLTRAIAPDIAVVLHVQGIHLEHFGTLSKVAEEKGWVVRRVRPGGLAVLNSDDGRVRAMAALTEERVVTFGTAADADLYAEEVTASPEGITARLIVRQLDGGAVEGWPLASQLLGARRLSNILAALAVARAVGVPTPEALTVVRNFRGPPGRLRRLRGRNGLTVLDDSYNASPEAVDSALETLRGFPRPLRAVLGEMRELGPLHGPAHRQVGAQVAPWLDELVAVGDGGRLIAASAVEHGMDASRVSCAEDADQAVRLVSDEDGDGTVLVKGANALQLDRVTRALLLDPADSSALDQDRPPRRRFSDQWADRPRKRRAKHVPLRIRAPRKVMVATLAFLARCVLWRHRPLVVGISGSAGKTTTKELIAAMLATRYRVWATPGSAGNDKGPALTVLGVQMTGPGPRGWIAGLTSGVRLCLRREDYPEVLVLELATASRGELRAITRSIRPDVAVVTNVYGTHLEYFRTIDAVAREKSWLVRRLRPGGVAVINADDPRVNDMVRQTWNRVVRYGESPDADFVAEDITRTTTGMAMTVRAPGSEDQASRTWSMETRFAGRHQLSGVLAALAVADTLGVSAERSLEVVREFVPYQGRLRPLKGRRGNTVLDDSYSASAPAMLGAIETLKAYPPPRTAVLGDMDELGPDHEWTHRLVGERLAPWVDLLVAVGSGGRLIAEAAIERGLDPERVALAADADQAVDCLADGTGGTLLVKGAAELGLERVTAAALEEEADAAHLPRRGPLSLDPRRFVP